MSLSLWLFAGFSRLPVEVPPIPPDMLPPAITDEEQREQIRINFEALLITIAFVAIVAALIYFLNKRSTQKRYAAHQAQLAAEGRIGRSSALSEVASGGAIVRGIPDDAPASKEERAIGQVFGENYRPYGKDGMNAPGT